MTNVITYAEIKNNLLAKYGSAHDRELVVHQTGMNDAVMWLAGSPPKGYCIAGNGVVSLYDIWGKRFKILHNTRFENTNDQKVIQ